MIEKNINYEPKKNNKFVVEFPIEFNIVEFTVNTITNPKYINGEWQDIHITFYDLICPSTTMGLYNLIKYTKDNNQEFTIKIKSLNQNGENVGTWSIIVKDTFTIDFGNLDYTSSEPQIIKMNLTPIDCNFTQP